MIGVPCTNFLPFFQKCYVVCDSNLVVGELRFMKLILEIFYGKSSLHKVFIIFLGDFKQFTWACFSEVHGHFLTNVTLPSRKRHRMGNPSYQNHSAGPKQGVNVIPTFPYGNVSIQQSLYVNAGMQSPHSAVPGAQGVFP